MSRDHSIAQRKGDYHLTMPLLSLIPLLWVDFLTYDGSVSGAREHKVICQCGLRAMMGEWV